MEKRALQKTQLLAELSILDGYGDPGYDFVYLSKTTGNL